MISEKNAYNTILPQLSELKKITEEGITEQLEKYLTGYENSFKRSQQIKYFKAFEKGLLSNLDRKSIEPIALSLMGEKEVRGMQQFFSRSKGWDEALKASYIKQLSQQLNEVGGFLSLDGSDFKKKGKNSAGVARQYYGQAGTTDQCQAGVFLSYASDKGIGIVDSSLYIPKDWFEKEYDKKRVDCRIPEALEFKTKNQMAKEMVCNLINQQLFEINCIGCDAAFGCDHTFLDSLPESMNYFASVRENEYIFRSMPRVVTPKNAARGGNQFASPRAEIPPVHIKTIINDDSVPWVKRVISNGTKGPMTAEVKYLRCVSTRMNNWLHLPKAEIWVYIRKYDNGTVKYFISNMPENTDISELDRLAVMRWSIEQCFQECKSYLGMTHYETRSYPAWHRHMLMVMIAQLFVTVLRLNLKKNSSL